MYDSMEIRCRKNCTVGCNPRVTRSVLHADFQPGTDLVFWTPTTRSATCSFLIALNEATAARTNHQLFRQCQCTHQSILSLHHTNRSHACDFGGEFGFVDDVDD